MFAQFMAERVTELERERAALKKKLQRVTDSRDLWRLRATRKTSRAR